MSNYVDAKICRDTEDELRGQLVLIWDVPQSICKEVGGHSDAQFSILFELDKLASDRLRTWTHGGVVYL